MDELISVIVNVYNGEKFIKKCLDSVINQTYKNIEIIIVNDGSTDNTLSICESYKDNRIKIINQENMGLSLSRNVGIDNSTGEYLFFVDVDDYIELDAIEYLYKLTKENNTMIATCSTKDIHNYDFKVKPRKEIVRVISGKEMLKNILMSKDRFGTVWNKLIKKELFDNIRFEDRIINDVVVLYKLALATEKVTYSNQIKYYYLRHSNSITAKRYASRTIDFYKAAIERYNYIKNIYPEFEENEICLCWMIERLYVENTTKNEVLQFLNSNNAAKLYKEKFKFKYLFSSLKFREKVKLFLFKISPKFCCFVVDKYIKTKKSIKNI